MEKFSLKWNHFETNVSKSFRNLRKQENFFDVTLVSDDEQFVSAHKLVLSASSDFFKNILVQSNHSNPLIYIPGIQSKDLHSLMDYIYDGEVQLYQDNLDNFLEIAQKLKIEGLINEFQNFKHEDIFLNPDEHYDSHVDEHLDENQFDYEESSVISRKKPNNHKLGNYKKSVAVNQDYSTEELAQVVNDLITKDGHMWICNTCGKTSKWNKQMKQHVELHIEGLSIPCPQCDSTFRCRNSLSKHKQLKHQSQSG